MGRVMILAGLLFCIGHLTFNVFQMYSKENDLFRTFQIIMEDHDQAQFNMNEHAHMPMFEITFKSNAIVDSNLNDLDIFDDEPPDLFKIHKLEVKNVSNIKRIDYNKLRNYIQLRTIIKRINEDHKLIYR